MDEALFAGAKKKSKRKMSTKKKASKRKMSTKKMSKKKASKKKSLRKMSTKKMSKKKASKKMSKKKSMSKKMSKKKSMSKKGGAVANTIAGRDPHMIAGFNPLGIIKGIVSVGDAIFGGKKSVVKSKVKKLKLDLDKLVKMTK